MSEDYFAVGQQNRHASPEAAGCGHPFRGICGRRTQLPEDWQAAHEARMAAHAARVAPHLIPEDEKHAVVCRAAHARNVLEVGGQRIRVYRRSKRWWWGNTPCPHGGQCRGPFASREAALAAARAELEP